MKRLLKFICLLLILSTCSFPIKITASSLGYAQVKNSTTLLYRTSQIDESLSNVFCYLEESYFVEILSEAENDFYKVYYNGVIGYVKKNKVERVSETPKKPYPNNIYFDIADNKCYLRSLPKSSENNVITTLNSSTKSMRYIGKISGEESIDFTGSTWYLTEYEGQIGYVYFGYTENLNTIFPNVEKVSHLSNSNALDRMNPLSNTTCIIVIGCILLPCLFIMFLMFKPKRIKAKVKTKYKEDVDISKIEFYDDREL